MAYQKQTWRDFDDTKTDLQNINNGAVVTPERLNHIENGIANSADKAEVTAQLQQTEQELNAQLAQKAKQSDVDTAIANIGNGSPKGTYGTLSALQTAFPNGATGIYVVSADGKWYYWNGEAWETGGTYQSTGIAEKSIISQQLAFSPAKVIQGKNLFNRKTVTSGYYINAVTQEVIADANYSYSDYIPVYGNTTYSRLTATHTLFYDKNKVYISGTTNKTFTTPVNAMYVRISLPNLTLFTEQLELGSANTAYETYGATLKELKEGSIPYNLLGQLNIAKKDIQGVVSSVNLFNLDTVTRGRTANSTGTAVSTGWNHTDYIDVNSSSKYIFTYALGTFAFFYDENKVYISAISVGTGTAGYVLTTPANAKYMRINLQDSRLADYMIVKGEVLPTEYVKYSNTIDWLTFKDESVKKENLEKSLQTAINTKWKGKKFVTFGDSITHYDGLPFNSNHIESGTFARGYQTHMREKLGCIVDKQGYDGAHIKLISSGRIKTYASYADVDAVTITSGANDHRIGFAPGTVQPIGNTFNLDTYAGAFQDAIEYLLAQKPTLKIYLITPVKGWYTSETTTRYNGENIISETYINIVKEIAELYSLPLLDWYHESGINELTKDVNGTPLYIGDNPAVWTSYQLHPTNAGYERMADILIPFLLNK